MATGAAMITVRSSVDASVGNALADAGLEFVRVFGHDGLGVLLATQSGLALFPVDGTTGPAQIAIFPTLPSGFNRGFRRRGVGPVPQLG